MNKGFTLVELISVITILGLLVIITTPAYDTISKNIKTRNYQSKQSTIKSETLAYVEKYMKDKVYDDENDKGKRLCFTVDFLIHNGIIASDSDSKEYILNEVTGDKYLNDTIYLQVFYDYEDLKMKTFTKDELKDDNTLKKDTVIAHAFLLKPDNSPKCSETY